jgi:glycosyltransferase involved in cell wall biosynthesis
LKVLYLHQYFATPEAAVATRSYELARRLVALGHQVTLLTSSAYFEPRASPKGTWSQHVVAGIDVRVLNLAYANEMDYAERVRRFGRFAWASARLASSVASDVVFATSTPLTIALPGVLASRRQGIPMVFEVRDLWPDVPIALGALRSPASRYAAKQLEAWAYQNATALITTSPGWIERLREHPSSPAQVEAVPHGADWEHFGEDPEAGSAFRESRSWLQNRPLILYAGTLGLVNGLGYLVDVAAELAQIRPEACWLFLGEGRVEHALREQARRLGLLGRQVFFEDSVPKHQVAAAYTAATLTASTVLPSARSGVDFLPNKVVDSLTCGRPVALNYNTWLRRQLETAGAGFYMPPESPSAGARAIESYLDDESRREASRESALGIARRCYDRDEHATALARVLERAVSSPRLRGGGRRSAATALADLLRPRRRWPDGPGP